MPPRRPNLLFIYTDEQAVGTLGGYGNSQIEMPHLNALAERSVVFDQAYVTQPVCTPSRASLLTGLYPHTHGLTENNLRLADEVPCLPELGDFSGYRTAHMGKWHLGDEVFAQHGFDEWVSVDDGYRGYYSPSRDRDAHSDYFHWLVDRGLEPDTAPDGFRMFGRGTAARLPEEHSKPAFIAEQACRFLRDHRAEPFLLYVNFFEPHMPFTGPRDSQYDPADIPLPRNFDAIPGPDQPLKLRLFAEHYRRRGIGGLPLQSPDDWRRLIANYWGLCSQVDTHAGRILTTLRELGLEDDTIIVYTSDHGDMMGSHRLVAKCTQYQEAVRVPLLIRAPWWREKGRVAAPVSQVDLVPTLLELLAQKPSSSLQGQSLLDGEPRDVVVEWNGANNGIGGDVIGGGLIPEHLRDVADPAAAMASIADPVRTLISPDGLKLNHSPLGEHELYDLNEDPGETRNLVHDPARRKAVAEMRERLGAWQERTGDW